MLWVKHEACVWCNRVLWVNNLRGDKLKATTRITVEKLALEWLKLEVRAHEKLEAWI